MARRLIAAALLAGLLTTPVVAQVVTCGDSLLLRSPESLDVSFDRNDFRAGNRLTWPEVSPDDAACFRLVASDAIIQKFDPQVHGSYVDIYDRELTFTTEGNGQVGDTTRDRVQVFLAANHPNEAVPSLNGVLNVSNRGGVFRLDVAAGTAVQSNGPISSPIPAHLPTTNVTRFSTWTDGSATRVYAAIDGLPLARSDDFGATWVEPSLEGDPIGFPITSLAVSPSDPDIVYAGTNKRGLWRSLDGGATFERADQGLQTTDSAVVGLGYLRVDAGSGSVDRLFVSIAGIGFYFSDDNGATYTEADLMVPGTLNAQDCLDAVEPNVVPSITTVKRSPTDANVVYAGLKAWGVYRSTDGGASWTRANDVLVRCQTPGGNPPSRSINVDQLHVFAQQQSGNDALVVSTEFNGVWVTTNSGGTWNAGTGIPEREDTTLYRVTGFLEVPGSTMSVIATTRGAGLIRSNDFGASWCEAGEVGCDPDPGITTPTLSSVAVNPLDPNDVLIGTSGAGVYRPGMQVGLTRILDPNALGEEFADANLETGLAVSLGNGSVSAGDAFRVRAQTFQGYAVWRAVSFLEPVGDLPPEPEWELIGLYDVTNPEFCFGEEVAPGVFEPTDCDAPNPQRLPDCFSDKRANCFEFKSNGTVEFFDRDVYNGFTYQYAVSTFDYGFTGNIAPRGFDGDMLFSPRSAQESSDQAYPRSGPSNRVEFQVNVVPTGNLDNVIVVPNPLRRQGGWDTGAGATVRFVNVTPDATCEIFTLAGDLVRSLTNAETGNEQRGNIQWDTRNDSGEEVASGVYLYRITDEQGGEHIGRFTIIR